MENIIILKSIMLLVIKHAKNVQRLLKGHNDRQ